MGAWPDLATATLDLRRFLNDGPQDRFVKSKQLIGPVDGVNTEFWTFEDRIVQNTLVVTIEFQDVVPANVSVPDWVTGGVIITPAPPQLSTVRARYYFQYFLDAELQEALALASGEIQESDDVTLTPFGLKGALLNYAAYWAFTKQAIRWAQRMSEKWILLDSPVEADTTQRSNLFLQLAKNYYSTAKDLRNSYYNKRHDRGYAPAMAVFKPNIPPIQPLR